MWKNVLGKIAWIICILLAVTSKAATQPSPTALQPTNALPAQLHVSGTMHIETRRLSWPEPNALLAFLKRATTAGCRDGSTNGMRWSIGADIGWLNGEPRAGEIIRATEGFGVQWDVHAHQMKDRANCAAAIRRLGGHPNAVASGLLLRELDELRKPITGLNGATWQAQVLWGIALQSLHGPGADDFSIGLWRPRSAAAYLEHDPLGTLIAVGNGHLGLQGVEQLATNIPPEIRHAPVISASIMVSPRTLCVVGSNDGIDAIVHWANRMASHSRVKWATISETAEAWKNQGEIPSRATVDGTPPFRLPRLPGSRPLKQKVGN